MDAPVLTILGITGTLVQPSPLLATALLRTDEERAVMDASELWALGAAALLESWPQETAWPVNPRPRTWRVRESPMEHGHKIFDQLVRAGASVNDLFPVLAKALTWATRTVVTQGEVDVAKDFSEAPMGG